MSSPNVEEDFEYFMTPKRKPGCPKTRKTKTCWRCHVTLSTNTKLKLHLQRKSGCGPKAIAKQVTKNKQASRLSSKVQYIKHQLDKVGWWDDEEEKDGEDEIKEVSLARNVIWVTDPDNLKRAKAIASVDWSHHCGLTLSFHNTQRVALLE
ncbi:hypothetical protein V7S43_018899 [Phytophthora oleae]|uniref:BED-type domain-containing protein n=1 Tax=Phytophthora oleae TaxID=2107226 RepID=A0ABD3EPA1_9STRA